MRWHRVDAVVVKLDIFDDGFRSVRCNAIDIDDGAFAPLIDLDVFR